MRRPNSAIPEPRRAVMPVLCGLAGIALAGTLLLSAMATIAQELPFPLSVHPVELSESPSADGTIGRIRAHGMLQLPSIKIDGMRFSQLSGLAWDDDDGVLYALSDKGYLFHLKPVIRDDYLVGMILLKAVHLTELKDGTPLRGARADSEGLGILRGRNGVRGDAELIVSFERFPRIWRYAPDGRALGELSLPAPLADAAAYRDPNQMLESVCIDPTLGVLTVPEYPLRNEPAGFTRFFSVSGKSWRYPQTKDFGISDIACLGDGRVLVLERNFGHLFGSNAISLKLTTLPATPSANEPLTVTTMVTLDAGLGHQIDNFEGLTRHKDNRFFMVSDDNDLFIQRTLLLYFELLDY